MAGVKMWSAILCSALLISFFGCSEARSFGIDYENDTFVLDGKPFRYVSGSIHYSRVPYQYWADRLTKMFAGGLNAIQVYIPWNIHEPFQGQFDFSGQQDVVGFLKLAHSIGLYVILRPGPYICAEWEFGGFPAWLLKGNNDIQLRSSDPRYIKAVDQWFDVLLSQIAPLLYVNGGPIISVQVENEYGSYFACDYDYLRFLRQKMIDILGEDVVLFTTDGDGFGYLRCGTLLGLYTTIDFGITYDPAQNFQVQREWEPKGPLVNSEFYTGWLDHWGESHSHTDAAAFAKSLDLLLGYGANVNMYMFEGGTNFGFWNGAEYPPFSAIPTSYDYDAPLSEAGDITEKYIAIRQVISKSIEAHTSLIFGQNHLINIMSIKSAGIQKCLSGANSPFAPVPTSYDYDAPLTEAGDITDKYLAISKVISKYYPPPPIPIPPNTPKFAYGKITMSLIATVPDYLEKYTPDPIKSTYPINMEEIDHYYGFVMYRHILKDNVSWPTTLDFVGVRDRGYVMINQIPFGIVEREKNTTVNITGTIGDYLDILVENQGRINYGNNMNDNRKGLITNVTHDGEALVDWLIYSLVLENITLVQSYNLKHSYPRQNGLLSTPALYAGPLVVPREATHPMDTYFDMSTWTKGQAWLNNFNLGRYWPAAGPQIRLYVPKYVLNQGVNTVVMLESESSPCMHVTNCFVSFMDEPLINALRHQIHGPRASSGVCVEEEQSPDNFDVKNKQQQQQQSQNCFYRAQDDQKKGSRGQQGSKCDRTDFWSLVHGPNRGFDAIGWGGTLFCAFHFSRLHWFEHGRREEGCRFQSLLYKVAYAITREEKTFTGRNNVLGAPSSSPLKTAETDGKKQEDSAKTRTVEEDPLTRAMSNFEELCKQYTATGKSVIGLAQAQKGHMQVAIQHWQVASELGYAKAQFNLAVCYETGNGVKKDLKKAMEYYHLAAEENHSMSQYNLGLLYLEGGEDVQINKALGIKYLEKSAELGLAKAQTYLGVYYTEKGSKADMQKAVEYFKQASEQNDPDAQYSLGLCYEEGWGVEQDECKAAHLYSQAAQSGHDGAMYNLGVFQQYGLGGLPEDLVSAKELFQKAAAAENESAKLQLQELEAKEAIKEWKELYENKQPPPKDRLTRPGHFLRMNSSFSSPNLTEYVREHMSQLGFSTAQDPNSTQQVSSKPENIMEVKYDSFNGRQEKVIFTLGPDEEDTETQTLCYLEDLAGYEMSLQSVEESRSLPHHCSMLQRNSTMPELQFVTCS